MHLDVQQVIETEHVQNQTLDSPHPSILLLWCFILLQFLSQKIATWFLQLLIQNLGNILDSFC